MPFLCLCGDKSHPPVPDGFVVIGGADKGGESSDGGGDTELALAVKMGTNDCQGIYGW